MIGFLEGTGTEDNYRACQRYTREHAKSFYFASYALPPRKRIAAYAVYAFCRHADNIVDTATATHNEELGSARLQTVREQLHYAYTGSPLLDPKLTAFRETVNAYNIPRKYFQDLLAGVEMDLHRTRYESFDQLRQYCYCVASVVGLVMSHILGVSDDSALESAADLGTAMQLTNILRDVGEDFRMGRVYLPEEDLIRFGVTEVALRSGAVDERFAALMVFEIARAREYFARAHEGIDKISNDGSRFCVRLMSGTYSRILAKIEANGYDVFRHRAHVHLREKLLIAAGAAFGMESSSPRLREQRPAPVPRTASGMVSTLTK